MSPDNEPLSGPVLAKISHTHIVSQGNIELTVSLLQNNFQLEYKQVYICYDSELLF